MARVVVEVVGSEHKWWDDDVIRGRRRRRRWRRWHRLGDVERRQRRGGASLANIEEEIREPFQFMVGCSSKTRGLNTHVLHQLKDANMSPQVAMAKGSTHSSNLVLVLDDGKDLSVVSRANDDLAAERDVFKGRVNVGHKVAEGHVKAFEHRAVKHGDLVVENQVGTLEEIAIWLAEGNSTGDDLSVDVGLHRRLASGVESRAPVHQQSGYTGGGHGEGNVPLRSNSVEEQRVEVSLAAPTRAVDEEEAWRYRTVWL